MAVNTDPDRDPNLRVTLQRKCAGLLLEAGSVGLTLKRRLTGVAKPDARFVIFGRGRSGSTLLVSMLDNHPSITCAGEVLRFRTLNPMAHLNRVLNAGGRPVSGAKLLSYQMRTIHGMGPNTDFLRRLSNSGVTIIYLSRENLVRHAISNIYARTQRIYHQSGESTAGPRPARPRINITVSQISSWIEGSTKLGDYEQAVLQDVPHLPITYESNLATATARDVTWDNLLHHFDLKDEPLRTTMQKVTADDLRLIVANHDELMIGLSATPYHRFLSDIDLSTGPTP